MTGTDGTRPLPDEPTAEDPPVVSAPVDVPAAGPTQEAADVTVDADDDGPVIDPRDPLGLGDVAVDEPTTGGAGVDEARGLGAGAAAGADGPTTSPGGLPFQDEAVPVPADPATAGPATADPAGPDDGPAHEDPAHDALSTSDPSAGDPSDATRPADAALDPAAVAPAASESLDSTDQRADAAASSPDGQPPDGRVQDAGAGAPPVVPRSARSGWARLGHAMRPRTTQGQLITAGLCALLGFALVVQVRQTTDTQLGALRQNDLVRLLDETTTRTDELEQESQDLQRERDELLSGSDRQQAALDAARRNAAMQGILTGRLPATGPGVRITLSEPEGEIRPATMLHVLEELRNAGAEAMELNGQRITASSAFTGTRGAVELDGTVIVPPYRWLVIGDPDTIAPALEIPGGALVRVRADGGRATVEKSDRVDVTAVRVLPDPVHASPATDEG